MSSYIDGEMLGSNAFTNFLAKLDPTSSKTVVGKIAKGLPIVGPAFVAAGAIGASLKSASKTQTQPLAQVPVDTTSIYPIMQQPIGQVPFSMTNPMYLPSSYQQPKSDSTMIAVIAGAVVLLTFGFMAFKNK